MFQKKVKFDTISQVQKFVDAISKIDADFDIIHNRYVIDAKSIMGIFSLDLSTELKLNVHTEDKDIEKTVTGLLKEIGVLR